MNNNTIIKIQVLWTYVNCFILKIDITHSGYAMIRDILITIVCVENIILSFQVIFLL